MCVDELSVVRGRSGPSRTADIIIPRPAAVVQYQKSIFGDKTGLDRNLVVFCPQKSGFVRWNLGADDPATPGLPRWNGWVGGENYMEKGFVVKMGIIGLVRGCGTL